MKTINRLGLAVASAAMLLVLGLSASALAAPPALTISSPVSGAVIGTASVLVSGTTNASTPVMLKVQGSSLFIERPAAPSGEAWSSTVNLPDGTYEITAEQEEGSEATSVESTVTVKTAPPALSLAAPSISGESVAFSGHAGSEPGDEEVMLEVFEVGAGTALQKVSVIREGGNWRSEPLELPAGKYSVEAVQHDSLGKERSLTRQFTIAGNAPVVTLATPEFTMQGGTLVSSSATPRFQAEPVSGIKAVVLDVYRGTSAIGEPAQQVAMSAFGEVWSATVSQPLSDGIYTAQAEVEDLHGGTGVSSPVIFSVQVPAPTIAPTSPGATPPTASFTWVPATPAAGQSVSLVSNSTNGSSPIGAFAWDVAGNSSFAPGGSVMSTSFATPGAHIVHLRVTDANGLSSVATRTISVGPPALKLLQPFPIVRIAGAETGSGVRIRLLTVQAPLSATVAVTCKGTGCKTKSESRVATASAKNKSKGGVVMLTFNRFERALRAGVVLQIRVTKPGQIGKFTSFKIRRHKLPLRADSCLSSASAAPIACPTS